MSHNSGSLVPYISEHTTTLGTAGAGQSLVIKGSLLGLSAVVDIPSALGVETARSFTKTGATAGVLTITLTVENLPDPPVNRGVAVSIGGVPCQGPDVTAGVITLAHGWNPGVLCTGDKDYWWNPDSLSLTEGDAVNSFTDSVNGLALTEGTTTDFPTFKDSTYVWSGSKTAAAISSDTGDGLKDVIIPLELTGGVLETTFAFVCKLPTISTTNQWPVNVHVGGDDTLKRFGFGLRRNKITLVAPNNSSASYNPGGDIITAGQVVAIIITASGGTATVEPIPGTMASALTDTYTPATASTQESFLFQTLGDHAVYGETIVMSRAITASEITQLKAYWAVKYGS